MSHVGEIGERLVFQAQLVHVATRAALFNGMPFRTLRFHVLEGGAVLLWRTSAPCDEFVVGALYRFKATVKAHRVGVPVCGQPDEWTDILRVEVVGEDEGAKS